jgi:hypothetical protein
MSIRLRAQEKEPASLLCGGDTALQYLVTAWWHGVGSEFLQKTEGVSNKKTTQLLLNLSEMKKS